MGGMGGYAYEDAYEGRTYEDVRVQRSVGCVHMYVGR